MQEDINNLQKNMIKMQTDISYIKEALDENKAQHKEIMDKMEDWIKASEKRFAGRWTEKIIIWTGIGIGGALIVAFMNLIIK